MYNIQQNFFETVDKNNTKWVNQNKFAPTNFYICFITMLMPKAFKKQSDKYLTNFKTFTESETSLAK